MVRDPGPGPYQRPGSDQAIVPHVGVFQKRGVHAEEDVVAHPAAVNGNAVGHQYVVAQLQVVVGVHHAVVLDGAGLADDYLAVVAPDDRSRPYAGVLANFHVADDVSRLADEDGGVNLGFLVA